MCANYIELNKNQTVSESDPFTTVRYQSFLKYFNSAQKNVLDFGCNTGRGGVLLKSLRPDIILTGADIVKERLSQIPSDSYDKIIDLSSTTLLESINKFDVIVLGEVIEHIPFTDVINYLKTFHTILNDDGVLLLTTPNPHSFLVKLGRDSVLKDPSHINIMDRHFLSNLVLKLGFTTVIIKGSGKVIKYLGEDFPIFNIYGSYLIIAHK